MTAGVRLAEEDGDDTACLPTSYWMNTLLLNRSLGSIPPATVRDAQLIELTHCLAPAPGITFAARRRPSTATQTIADATRSEGPACAHGAGATVLAIDQYDRRFMVSGGADASIHLWDLESRGPEVTHTHLPAASGNRLTSRDAHQKALTSLSIYPFDPVPATVLTTAYDGTLKLSALDRGAGHGTVRPAASFALHATPYSHALSAHSASLLLVAVGTSDAAVRLVDLRSGLATHALPGHDGAVLSVAWAPHSPFLLASGSVDGRALLFDVRRGGKDAVVAALDMDDALGVGPGRSSRSSSHRAATACRAHTAPVTGVRWTDDGRFLATAGQDSRVRVWNASSGANTLVHFGPRLRNAPSLHLAERAPLLVPSAEAAPLHDVLVWPNHCADGRERGEVLAFSALDGGLVSSLQAPGLQGRARRATGRATAVSAARINALAWRGNGASGQGLEMFSAHGDGSIRAWVSRDEEGGDDESQDDDGGGGDAGGDSKKRKRDVLDEIHRGLVQTKVTFT